MAGGAQATRLLRRFAILVFSVCRRDAGWLDIDQAAPGAWQRDVTGATMPLPGLPQRGESGDACDGKQPLFATRNRRDARIPVREFARISCGREKRASFGNNFSPAFCALRPLDARINVWRYAL